MNHIQESTRVKDVYLVSLKAFSDERGRFMETFRKAWFPQRRWDIIQTNCSHSKAGVLRGLHYHHQQVDYWFVPDGRLRVGLADLRPSSPTYLAHQMIELGQDQAFGLFIPVGVAHGFLSLTDATLIYLVDNYYDGEDEHGVAWNDPTLKLDWGLSDPILSGRDEQNPYLQDIPAEKLPR